MDLLCNDFMLMPFQSFVRLLLPSTGRWLPPQKYLRISAFMCMAYQYEYIVIKAKTFWGTFICTVWIQQSTAIPYKLCGISICKQFNCTIQDLLQTLSEGQKKNWPIHLRSLTFAYNAMSHSTIEFQPHELMFHHKAATVCNGWLELANCNDQFSQSKI